MEVFLNPRLWRAEVWVNHAMHCGPSAMRIAYLLEVGIGKDKEKGESKKMI